MGYTPPQLEVRKITGGWAAYGPTSTTTDDLSIFANTTDTTPKIKLLGTSNLELYSGSGASIDIFQAATQVGSIYYTSPDLQIRSIIDTKNIYLRPTGTGLVKFGTWGAEVAAVNGYITILDAAGNTRKLATIA